MSTFPMASSLRLKRIKGRGEFLTLTVSGMSSLGGRCLMDIGLQLWVMPTPCHLHATKRLPFPQVCPNCCCARMLDYEVDAKWTAVKIFTMR